MAIKGPEDKELKLYWTGEAADFLRVSARTVEGWRARGVGPTYTKVGRLVFYTHQDLINWLAENKHVAEKKARVEGRLKAKDDKKRFEKVRRGGG